MKTSTKTKPRRAALSPQGRRARELLEAIDWHTQQWRRYGWATPRLPEATQAILERAAKGGDVDPAELHPVIAAAEALDTTLAFGTLKRFPRIEDLS
jgi:hypothetical protein